MSPTILTPLLSVVVVSPGSIAKPLILYPYIKLFITSIIIVKTTKKYPTSTANSTNSLILILIEPS